MSFLGFDVFLSRGLYGERPARHFDAYKMGEGWYFLESGSFTLELSTPSPSRVVVALSGFLTLFGVGMIPMAAEADQPGVVQTLAMHVARMLAAGYGP